MSRCIYGVCTTIENVLVEAIDIVIVIIIIIVINECTMKSVIFALTIS